jgi:hypothetical protein
LLALCPSAALRAVNRARSSDSLHEITRGQRALSATIFKILRREIYTAISACEAEPKAIGEEKGTIANLTDAKGEIPASIIRGQAPRTVRPILKIAAKKLPKTRFTVSSSLIAPHFSPLKAPRLRKILSAYLCHSRQNASACSQAELFRVSRSPVSRCGEAW